MKTVFFISALAVLLTPIRGLAQIEISKALKDELIKDAHKTVTLYQSSLVILGSSEFETYEKTGVTPDILGRFDRNDVSVYNDIDPSGKEADQISISRYLGNITTFYNKYGVRFKTKIDKKRSGVLYQDREDHSYLFTKVVAERTVVGRPNNHDSINNKLWIDIYLQFSIDEQGLNPNAYIYSIRKHEDNVSDFVPVLISGERPQVQQTAQQTPVQNTSALEPTPCNTPNTQPTYGSASDTDEAWSTYYHSSPIYENAVKDGVVGNALVEFMVTTDGAIVENSIIIQLHGVVGSQSAVRQAVRELILASSTQGTGWQPGTIDCKPATASVKGLRVRFSEKAPCHVADHQPWFNGSGKEVSDAAWKNYISKSEVYRKAVMDDGIWDEVKAEFAVEATGKIDSSTIRVFSIEGAPKPASASISTINGVVKQLVIQSNSFGKGWTSAFVNCENTDQQVTRIINFNKRSVAPKTITPEGRNSVPVPEVTLSEKEQRKADWKEHKEKEKGGVHFSFGGTGNIGVFSAGGVEFGFGGLFGSVFGMEARYASLFAANQLAYHLISTGIILNASPKRWPARFYFPLRVTGIFTSRTNLEFGLTFGLLCFDVKLGKFGSMYFELASGRVQFSDNNQFTNSSPGISRQGIYWTPSIGFRITKW